LADFRVRLDFKDLNKGKSCPLISRRSELWL